ncbi:hypothetical protein HPB47_026389 [Ixodes persulcatus]|uniref:Uncharacterized protein n=1 Tax=Ixodes persulcatus TaxID=34615 RepID=A0AC60Q0N3_IXOPE|nr:hypothetical protein HPB47_026389 [Ixodes persulcatus]
MSDSASDRDFIETSDDECSAASDFDEEPPDFQPGPVFEDILSSCFEQFGAEKLPNTETTKAGAIAMTSVWPIQFVINELPPHVRFKHPTLAGLWFGKTHPNMQTFIGTFVEAVNSMQPVKWKHGSHLHQSKAFVLCCSVDAPARAAVQNMVLFNGYHGCPWCLITGEYREGSMRYIADEPPALRSSAMVSRDMQLALAFKDSVNGIKGPSAMMNLPGFDLVTGYSVEYMHCVLQGVAKQVAELLFSSSNSNQRFYIGTAATLARVNARLLCIKPPHCITRLPRSLCERSYWKASEWRHWLLFYMLPCLQGILPVDYWKLLAKLCEAVHILLRDSIALHEIQQAELLLETFVGRSKTLFGVTSATFNVHQLLHLCNCVRQLGPLWAHSAFVFEGGNGRIVKLVSAARGLPDQILERVVMAQQVECLLATAKLPDRERDVCTRIEDFKHELERLNVLKEVASIGAYQMNHVWIVTLRSSAATYRLVSAKELTVKGRRCLVIDPSNAEIRLKIHWIPFHVSNDAVRKAMEPYGKVTEVARETWKAEGFEGIESATRLVRINLKEAPR